MLALIACLAAIQIPIDQPPRLRTILPNGAAITVERMPGAKSLAMQLVISSRGTEESPITNGLRHLLEHIIAKGPKGNIDLRLEKEGGFLTAETTRDAMAFRLSLPIGKLEMGAKILKELTQLPPVTTDSIRQESLILEQEFSLLESSSKISATAWQQLYGDKGLDPNGNLDVIRNATPAMLATLHKVQFTGGNLVISVAGDVDLDVATSLCLPIVAGFPKSVPTLSDRKPGTGGQATIDGFGIGYCLPVPGIRVPETAARLAAALAIASEVDQAYVIYTPSALPGVVTLGRDDDKHGLAKAVASAKPELLFERGKAMARSWILRRLNSPDQIATIRGILMANSTDLKPEVLLENINAVTYKQFSEAMAAFNSDSAVVVNGR